MTSDPASWPRARYRPAGRPFVFLVVFGASMAGLSVSRSRHRCQGVPDGLDVQARDARRHGDWIASLREGYLWDELERDDPHLAQATAATQACIVLRGEPADDTSLDYLRDVIGLVQAFFEHGAASVYDPQRFKWWSATGWRREVFEPARPTPQAHVVILTSPEDGGTAWVHTRGMRLFGRPDLSMRHVTTDQQAAVIEMFNRFITLQAEGDVVPDGQGIRMRGLPDGLHCHHAGEVDDPDFNNTHIAITRRA